MPATEAPTIATSRRFRLGVAACGLGGLIALAVYFIAPLVAAWPVSGGSPTAIAAYALSHQTLFFAGAWFQATGTLLSIVLFLAIIVAARAATSLSGLMVIVASTTLLAVVLVEGALLAYVPIAAAAGDVQSAATAFGLVNGVFVRVFPLAPASVSYLGLGAVIVGSKVLDRRFGYAAVSLGIAFEVAGLIAVFSPVGVIAATVLSAAQVLWVGAASVAFASAQASTA